MAHFSQNSFNLEASRESKTFESETSESMEISLYCQLQVCFFLCSVVELEKLSIPKVFFLRFETEIK